MRLAALESHPGTGVVLVHPGLPSRHLQAAILAEGERLRELYPGVNCKIFYQRDYLSLVSKYGLEDVSG